MGGLGGGSKPKKVKPPPIPAPVPIAQEVSPEVQRQSDDTRKRILSGRGRRGTVLTLNDESKSSVLG